MSSNGASRTPCGCAGGDERDRGSPAGGRSWVAQVTDTGLRRHCQFSVAVHNQGLRRPAIKDDEWVVVAVAAVLVFLVGELQSLLVTVGA